MQKSRGLWVVLGVLALAGVIAVWFVTHRARPAPSSSARAGSGSQTVAAGHAVAPTAAAPAHITVVVRDANGPVAGATVRLSRDDGDVQLVQSGADGTASSDALEPGTWTVSASAPGHEPASLTERALAAGDNVRLELTLVAGGRPLTGVVSDANGGPIAGARVDAAKVGVMIRSTSAVASTLTGSDGRYTLTVPEGQLVVAASEASYAAQARYVDVGPSGTVANFALVPGGVVEGVVRDEGSHDAVAGAVVTARSNAPTMLFGERRQQRAVAGPDGRFRITGLRPGGYELDATAGPRASRAPTVVALGVAEQASDVEIVVGRVAVVRGTVIDEQGAPAAGAEVLMFGGERTEPVSSDASGAFTIDGVGPGRYTLLATGAHYLSSGPTPVDVASADVNDVKVRVQKGLTIRGHVEPRQICDIEPEVDELGGRDMMPRLDMVSSRTTGADGAFEITPVDAVDYKLTARCPGGAHGTLKVRVTPGLADITLPVTPGGSIAGKVVDKAGKPVSAVSVMASPIEAGGERTTIVNGRITSGVQALTAADGTYTVRGLGAGEYRLGVLDRGRPLPMRTSDDHIKLSDGEQKTGVDLTVDRPDGTIRGTVVAADGKPIADAWVSVQIGIEDMLAQSDAGPGHHSSSVVRIEGGDDGLGETDAFAPVLTDAAGKFVITGLARVPMTVVAEAQAGALRGKQTAVTPDASITIRALGVTELRGTVHSSSASPALTWFTVELEGPSREQRTFTATPTGASFSFARVDPGTYTVNVTSNAGNGAGTVVVEAGKPANVDISLAANAIVVGKVVDATGKPLGGLPVAVIPESNDGRLQVRLEGPPNESGPDGAFRVETKAGPSIVVVMTQPTPTFKRGVLLEPGKTTDIGAVTVGEPPSGP